MSGDRVECRSDHDYTGRPLAFYWQDQRLEVAEVLVQYRTPQGLTYQVQTDGSGIFKLDYDTNADEWSVQPL
jgi:hypothetical protein